MAKTATKAAPKKVAASKKSEDLSQNLSITKLKKGSIISTTLYMTVNSVNVKNGEIIVTDQHGRQLVTKGKEFIEKAFTSADQFTSTMKVSRTELIEYMLSAKDDVFTASFVKQDGTNRTMIAHLIGEETKMGRSLVMDLEEGGPKQIDHRTLNWVILNGVKYTVK